MANRQEHTPPSCLFSLSGLILTVLITLATGLAGAPLWAGILAWLATINVTTLVLFRYDKNIAGTGRTRVPEWDLLELTFIGGSLGAWLGIYAFEKRHKTRDKFVQFFFWLIVVFHITLLGVLFLWAIDQL